MDQAGQDDHSRTLIHIDIDCFYAQVEMVKNPSLVNVPLGIQQKNIVVTSNYLARQYGIKKCMLVTEAQKLCPELVLANGEDLHDYRQISYKITSFLQKYSPLVERLGLDENFIDVTSLITETNTEVVGNTYGISDSCDCGCEKRLKFGTQIARDIRDAIKREFKLTCCAGIAHNKLLAKLACGLHKPNQQTVVFPNSGYELVTNLGGLSNIPGIGTATMNILKSMNITTITDLQNCDKHRLKCAVGPVKSKFLCDVAYALDPSPVKPSGRPQSIGLEDSCKSLSVETEIREKLAVLLQRLMVLIDEDGRAPKTIKLTIRKFDRVTKTSHRETKQCNINPSVFVGSERAAAQAKVMASVMHLFNKMVDTGKPYHITLLGLSCTKFQEPVSANNQLTKFLRKNFEVQSITNIENNKGQDTSPMDCDLRQSSPFASDLDSESEPSPKKLKFVSLLSQRKRFSDECLSPSKLSVADLRLSCERQDPKQNVLCPPDADKDVFRELPLDVQRELWDDYKRERDRSQGSCSEQIRKPKQNTLYNYFVKN